ncbi:MAG TPA: glutamate-cysteine ligase family protein, partial [Candidatus Eisenbacteria bacterium]|nr:glutamate-cysteine ligase family protein [Candidatus Eisenbacteria bacterium]
LEKNDAALRRLGREHGFTVNREPVPTKPFPIDVFPTERYLRIKEKFGERLRGAYVAGLHIHIGLGGPEEAVRAMNFVRVHLPAFLAISARSPREVDGVHWKSYRYDRYREMAGRTVPPFCTNWAHFAGIAADNGFGEDPRMCWWAVRISPHGTIELRVCDLQSDIDRTLGIAALFRMMVHLGVVNRRPVEAIPTAKIEERLLVAAHGRFDTGNYLVRAVKLASHPSFREEKPYIQKLLG